MQVSSSSGMQAWQTHRRCGLQISRRASGNLRRRHTIDGGDRRTVGTDGYGGKKKKGAQTQIDKMSMA